MIGSYWLPLSGFTQKSDKRIQELFKDFSRTKCMFSNWLRGGGGGLCSFWIVQIIYFTSYLHNYIFFTLCLSKIFISLSKILSTRFDHKLALVLMVKEPSDASVHKLKPGCLNYAERSEAHIFLRTRTIIYTLYHENLFWKYLFKKKTPAPAPLGNWMVVP